jgi:hypothetical protein
MARPLVDGYPARHARASPRLVGRGGWPGVTRLCVGMESKTVVYYQSSQSAMQVSSCLITSQAALPTPIWAPEASGASLERDAVPQRIAVGVRMRPWLEGSGSGPGSHGSPAPQVGVQWGAPPPLAPRSGGGCCTGWCLGVADHELRAPAHRY